MGVDPESANDAINPLYTRLREGFGELVDCGLHGLALSVLMAGRYRSEVDLISAVAPMVESRDDVIAGSRPAETGRFGREPLIQSPRRTA